MSKKKDKELQTTMTKWGVEVDENGEYVNFSPSICIKKYLSRHPIVIKDRLNYYAYDKEMYCWQKIDLEDVVKNIYEIIDEQYPDKWITSLDYDLKKLIRLNVRKAEDLKGASYLVNLENGFFNLKTMKFEPHSKSSKEYFTTYQLPFEYDEEAKCPKFKKFLKQIFLDDDELITLMQEIMGYCLSPRLDAHKFFMFYSEGSSGKSTLCDVFLRLAGGRENVSAVTLEGLNEKFSRIQLEGKIMNIATENEGKRAKTGYLKSMVCGDPVQLEAKGQSAYTACIRAKFIFSLNTLPSFRRYGYDMSRRMILIPFLARFVDEPTAPNDVKLIPNYQAKFTEELAGIFNFAMEGYKRLKENKFVFSKSKAADKLKAQCEAQYSSQYDIKTEIISAFIKDCITQDKDKRISNNALYKKFIEWCDDSETYNPFNTLRGFLTEARRQFEILKIDYKNTKSNGNSYISGISFTEENDNGEELLNDDE